MTEKKQENNNRKLRLNFIFIILTIGIRVAFAILDPNVTHIFDQISNLTPLWLLAAVVCVLIFWFFEALITYYLTNKMYKGYTLLKSLKISMIGLYYSALTPFASGGQPIQVAYMREHGVPVGKSTCMFSIKFIIFQVVVCVFFLVSIITLGTIFFSQSAAALEFALIGLAINLILVGLVVFAMINKKKLLNFILRIVNFLARIKIIKNAEAATENVANVLDDFHAGAIFLSTEKKALFIGAILTAIQMIINFAVTYCIYRAFGLSQRTVIEVIMMQSILFVTVSFIPLPGASLASEGGFYLFFKMFFPSQLMFLAMMLWRIFTYYANIIFGALVVVGDSAIKVFKNTKKLKSKV